MREVTMYCAFDDSEFLDRDECLQYEHQAVEAMAAVNDCYDFFDKDGGRYAAPNTMCEDVEEWMNWLSDAAEHCVYVKVHHILPELSARFIDREWGYCICADDFHGETGLFKYDDFKNEWVKVGE